MPPKDKYTDPELRDQVKKEIQESDKGGAPGQWSARKVGIVSMLRLCRADRVLKGTNDGARFVFHVSPPKSI